MSQHIAVKRLTQSDLTLFDRLFKQGSSSSKQKAINLNADVLADQFYPNIIGHSFKSVEIPVSVTIFGPLPSVPLQITRKITRTHKNFRLNGETIRDPDDDPERFARLLPGDCAVLEFHGGAIPEAITIVLVSAVDDPHLSNALVEALPAGKSMAPIRRSSLDELAAALDIPIDHPLRALLVDAGLDELIEQVVAGAESARQTLKKRIGRRLTQEDFRAARQRTDWIGEQGEKLAYAYLSKLAEAGVCADLVWASRENVISSWDFEASVPGPVRWDAKATTQKHETQFMISAAEVWAAASMDVPYRIIRVSEVTEESGQVRTSGDINTLARSIIERCAAFPAGVSPLGFAISPGMLEWDSPVDEALNDDAEE